MQSKGPGLGDAAYPVHACPAQAGPAADGDEANVAWMRDARAHVAPAALGCYVNEVMNDEPGQVARCYEPDTYARLLALKATADPLSLLRSL